MTSVNFTARSMTDLTILIDAVQFVVDIGKDMSIDDASSLAKLKGKEYDARKFDELVGNIRDHRNRMAFADNFLRAVKSAGVGEPIYITTQGLDVVIIALEQMQDMFDDQITEVFYKREFQNGTDAAGIEKMRLAVELALERQRIASNLLETFKSIKR